MKGFAKALKDLPWIVLLLLVIFFDGIVGWAIRVGLGKKTLTKVVGWVLFISFVMTLVSFVPDIPPVLAWIMRAICFVCYVADIVTVILYKKILLFAK